MKIWTKLYKNERIHRDSIYVNDKMHVGNIEQHLQNICHEMDICTPIITSTHLMQLDRFNSTKFKESDYIDYIDYDYMEVEIVPEEKTKKK